MTDLKPKDLEAAQNAFEFLKDDANTLDATILGKFMYSCGVNPSVETLKKVGLAEKPGQKKFKLEELLPILSQLQKEAKDQGCYEDFIECLKLYDKQQNGTMLAAELQHSLLSLGEKLNDDQVDEVFRDCLDEEDDDGQIEYIPFLRRMCELEPPIKPKKKKPAA